MKAINMRKARSWTGGAIKTGSSTHWQNATGNAANTGTQPTTLDPSAMKMSILSLQAQNSHVFTNAKCTPLSLVNALSHTGNQNVNFPAPTAIGSCGQRPRQPYDASRSGSNGSGQNSLRDSLEQQRNLNNEATALSTPALDVKLLVKITFTYYSVLT